jgi:hypothetical protein
MIDNKMLVKYETEKNQGLLTHGETEIVKKDIVINNHDN